MKFTLKLQLDSASELATFIQDMNMEIDLPFLDTSKNNEQVLQNLTQTIVNYELEIHSLKKQLGYSKDANIAAFEKYLDENLPVETVRTECPAIQPIQNHFTEAAAQPEPEAFEANTAKITETVIAPIVENSVTEVKPARKYVCKPKPCADCGKDFVATHNTVKWCNDCRSKKVKSPIHKSD